VPDERDRQAPRSTSTTPSPEQPAKKNPLAPRPRGPEPMCSALTRNRLRYPIRRWPVGARRTTVIISTKARRCRGTSFSSTDFVNPAPPKLGRRVLPRSQTAFHVSGPRAAPARKDLRQLIGLVRNRGTSEKCRSTADVPPRPVRPARARPASKGIPADAPADRPEERPFRPSSSKKGRARRHRSTRTSPAQPASRFSDWLGLRRHRPTGPRGRDRQTLAEDGVLIIVATHMFRRRGKRAEKKTKTGNKKPARPPPS